jgi:hypothetical protein
MKPRSLSLALLVLASLASGSAFAQPPGPHPVALWLRLGAFLPSDDTVDQVYSGALGSVVVQADWTLRGHVAVFGGVRYWGVTGHAVAESGAAGAGEGGTTHLTMTTGRFGGLVLLPKGPWDTRLGGGVTVNHYTEEWTATTGAAVSGTRAGWLAQVAVARRFATRWSAGVSVEYSGVGVPAGTGEFAAPAVDLGGLDVLFGGGIRF